MKGTQHRVCVIGAGPAGLACVKALRDAGVDCVCFEREDDVGGNWYFGRPNSSVYRGTHLISSKRLTEFADFPMPGDYPPFPSHQQALAYLRAYAETFGLYENIEFNAPVDRVEAADGGRGWRVHIAGEDAPRQFDRLMIANGHHWSPKFPSYPGEFTGRTMHARDFKEPEVLRDKRVVVVGAGNSGCDIAVEAARFAEAAWISVRRGYHFLPKFLRGRPIDSAGIRLQRWGLPLWLRRRIAAYLVRLTLGSPQRFGLPRPDHKLFETHPIINSQLFYYLGHGKLRPKPDIARLCGDEVEFTDGSREAVDLIVYATGYDVRFPFIDARHLNWRDGLPRLHLHAFHPQRNDLFVIGMIQPNGALWPLAELQAKVAARCIQLEGLGEAVFDWIRRKAERLERRVEGGIHFVDSPRHRLEVDYFAYRKQLAQILRKLTRRADDLAAKRKTGQGRPLVAEV